MRALAPAWPPGASRSITTVRSPSEAAYTAAVRPAGPAPTIARSYSGWVGRVGSPTARATSRREGASNRRPSANNRTGSRTPARRASISPSGTAAVPRRKRVSGSASMSIHSNNTRLRARNVRKSSPAGEVKWSRTRSRPPGTSGIVAEAAAATGVIGRCRSQHEWRLDT